VEPPPSLRRPPAAAAPAPADVIPAGARVTVDVVDGPRLAGELACDYDGEGPVCLRTAAEGLTIVPADRVQTVAS
jgi:hypothetical protein